MSSLYMNRMVQGRVVNQTNDLIRGKLLGLVFFEGDFKYTSVCGFTVPDFIFREEGFYLHTLGKFSDRFFSRTVGPPLSVTTQECIPKNGSSLYDKDVQRFVILNLNMNLTQ